MRLRAVAAGLLLVVALGLGAGCSMNPGDAQKAPDTPLVAARCGQQGFTLHSWGASDVTFAAVPGTAGTVSIRIDGAIADLAASRTESRTVVAARQTDGEEDRFLFSLIDFGALPPRPSLLASSAAEAGDLPFVHMAREGDRVCLTRLSADGRLRSLQIRSAAGELLWDAPPDFSPIVQRISASSNLGSILLQIEPSGAEGASLAVASSGKRVSTYSVPDVAFSEMLSDGHQILLGTQDPQGRRMLRLVNSATIDTVWERETEWLPGLAYEEAGRVLLMSWEDRTNLRADQPQESSVLTRLEVLDSGGKRISELQFRGSGPWLSQLSPDGAHAIVWPTKPDDGDLSVLSLSDQTAPKAIQDAVSGIFNSRSELIVLDQDGHARQVRLR